MTTITITPRHRTIIKRFLGKSTFVFVNSNGDISDLETVISTQPGTPRGTWHVVRDHVGDLMAADTLHVTDDTATAHANGHDIDLLTDQHGETAPHIPANECPEEPKVTIRSTDRHNRTAMKALAGTASKIGSLDAEQLGLGGMHLRGSLADTKNPALREATSDSASVVGLSTDRYQALLATFEAEPAAVDAVVTGRILTTAASRSDWTLTVTNTVSHLTFEKLGLAITAPHFTARRYPSILGLFTEDAPDAATVTAKPRDIIAALDAARDVDPKAKGIVLTSDGTVYAPESSEVPIAGAVAEQRDGSELLFLTPSMVKKQLSALGARWPSTTLRWTRPTRRMTVDHGHGLLALVMPRAPRNMPARPEAAESVA